MVKWISKDFERSENNKNDSNTFEHIPRIFWPCFYDAASGHIILCEKESFSYESFFALITTCADKPTSGMIMSLHG